MVKKALGEDNDANKIIYPKGIHSSKEKIE